MAMTRTLSGGDLWAGALKNLRVVISSCEFVKKWGNNVYPNGRMVTSQL